MNTILSKLREASKPLGLATLVLALNGCGNHTPEKNTEWREFNARPVSVSSDADGQGGEVAMVLDLDGNLATDGDRLIATTPYTTLKRVVNTTALVQSKINDGNQKTIYVCGRCPEDSSESYPKELKIEEIVANGYRAYFETGDFVPK